MKRIDLEQLNKPQLIDLVQQQADLLQQHTDKIQELSDTVLRLQVPAKTSAVLVQTAIKKLKKRGVRRQNPEGLN